MTTPKAVGIDLGTTNSCVAWVNASGRSALVQNAEGDLLTPSVVLFDDAEVIVGKVARTATTVNPEQVAEWVKRDMGAPVYHQPIRGEFLPPEVIQACILRKLRADIVKALGPTGQVVITVPAYFDEPRRKATADAGEMAGLTVLDIVNEPVAAALAFGETLGYLSPSGQPLAEMTVLVYDLGGGTFDATLLRLAPGDIRTLATDGDVQLGGYDWDLRLVDHVAEVFKTTHGLDPREDRASWNRLYNGVLDAKHTMSARRKANVRVDYGGQGLNVPLTRAKFEELTADLLERTAYTTRQLVAAAGLDWGRIDRVLLVGGSTRMPMVSHMLQEMTGLVPDHTVNPDEAVARGAALYAGYLIGKKDETAPQPAFHVTNVNSHSLGVEGIDPETMRKANFILIPRNTPLPAKFTERFMTKSAGQRSIVVQVLEGESSLPTECTAIGRTVVRQLPEGLPKNWPVEITFAYGTNGRLSVRAVVPGTHRDVSLELDRDVGLSREGISGWKQTVGSSDGFAAYGSKMEDEAYQAGPSPKAPQASQAAQTPAGDAATQRPASQPTAGQTPAAAPTKQAGAGVPTSPWGQAGGAQPQPAAPAPGGGAGQAPASGPAPPQAAGQPPGPEPPLEPDSEGTGFRLPRIPLRFPRISFRLPRVPTWVITVVGFVLSAVIGLGAGYLIVSYLFPQMGLPSPW